MNSNDELVEILERNFDLVIAGNEVDTESEYLKFILQKLSFRIEKLINSNVERLFQILYRIDVAQVDTDKAFDSGEIRKVSMKLAELIIIRQLKKIEYSNKFKKNP